MLLQHKDSANTHISSSNYVFTSYFSLCIQNVDNIHKIIEWYILVAVYIWLLTGGVVLIDAAQPHCRKY